MSYKFNWKKNFLNSSYTIFSNEKPEGRFESKFLSGDANGELFGKKYFFRTKGFFKQTTDVYDSLNNIKVAEISYKGFSYKADITTRSNGYYWKYNNLLNTKWSLNSNDRSIINYKESTTKGQADSNTKDPFLILSGLFIGNYYNDISYLIIFMVLFIVVI